MTPDCASALSQVPDDELIRRLHELVAHSQRIEADIVAHIGEVDERRLYARQAFPSMHAYCTQHLHLSEAEAYRRITVARAARKHAVLLTMLRDGRLHLTGIALLVPLLTEQNRDAIVERATHRTKREIEELIAQLAPRPDAPSVIRKLPWRSAVTTSIEEEHEGQTDGTELVPGRVARPRPTPPVALSAAPLPVTPPISASAAPPLASPQRVEPLSPGRYKVQFTASAELREKLERLKALMRSEVPGGDLAAILERAVTEKLERLDAKRFGRTAAPRRQISGTDTTPRTRHVPAAVRRAVRERDADRCRFVDEQGRRCSERHRLELHHRHPFGMGGDHSPGNLSLLCPAHNRNMAERDYGVSVRSAGVPPGQSG